MDSHILKWRSWLTTLTDATALSAAERAEQSMAKVPSTGIIKAPGTIRDVVDERGRGKGVKSMIVRGM